MNKLKNYFIGVDTVKTIKTFLLLVLMALFEVAGIASIMPFIGFIVNSDAMMETHYMLLFIEFMSFDKNNLFISIAISMGIFSMSILTVTLLVRSLTTYKLNIFIEETRHAISANLMKDYLNVDYKYIIENNSSRFLKAILGEVDQYIGQIFRPMMLMLAYSLVAFSVMFFLFIYQWQITLCILFVFGISYIVAYKILKKPLRNLGEQVVNTNEARFSTASVVTSGIKSIKIFGSESVFEKRFFLASSDFSKAQAGKQSLTLIPNDLIEFLVFGGTIGGILIYILNLSPTESEDFSKIFAPLSVFALAAYRLKPAIFNIFTGLSSLRYGDPIVSSIKNIKKELTVNKMSCIHSKNKSSFESFKYSNVTFRYHDDLKPVLFNQEIEIDKGDVIGIIGSSGSGKSTLVDILIGLLKPESGTRFINGDLIKNKDFSWEGFFGYVPQEIFVLDDDYYSNIAFGLEKEEINKSKVIEVCKKAKLHEFIQSNDKGYETTLGENGVRISGGQKQRIGIARALYFDPKVLILDEGTSALDEKVEDEILTSLDQLHDSISIIMITHRPSTLRICNKIFELKDGILHKT